MKALLLSALLGFSCWLISDLIELVSGEYGAAVVYLTSLFHLLVGIGIWGLYSAIVSGRQRLLLISTAMVSVGHLGLAALPLQVHWSGQSLMLILGAHPIYIALLVMWSVGMLSFCVSVIQADHQPTWIGWLMLIGYSMVIVGRPLNMAKPVVNLATIVLSVALILLCVLNLRPSHAQPHG